MAKKRRSTTAQSDVEKALTDAFQASVRRLYDTYLLAIIDAGADVTEFEAAATRFRKGLALAKQALEDTIRLSR